MILEVSIDFKDLRHWLVDYEVLTSEALEERFDHTAAEHHEFVIFPKLHPCRQKGGEDAKRA